MFCLLFLWVSSYVGVFHRTEIGWYPGKSLTHKILKKKPKKGSKNAKPITKTENCPSFFSFFSPPQVPEDDDDIDEDIVSAVSYITRWQCSWKCNIIYCLCDLLTGWRTSKSNGTRLRHWVSHEGLIFGELRFFLL